MSVYGYVHLSTGAHRSLKRSLDPLELKLQMVVSWEVNCGSLRKQQALLTAVPSLQSWK